MAKKAFAIACGAAVLLSASCGLFGIGAGEKDPEVTLSGVEWAIENIAPDYWSPPDPSSTCFVSFWIHYQGDISASDLKSVRVYVPGNSGSYWTMDSSDLDASEHRIGGWRRYWFSDDAHGMPIGAARAVFILRGGKTASRDFLVNAPGKADTDGYSFVKTEDSAFGGGTTVLPRAGITGGAIGSGTLSVSFTVDHPAFDNGYAWFEDGTGAHVGGFFYFRDPDTALISASLGGSLDAGGGTNTLSLSAGDIEFEPGKGLSDIARVRIVATDGEQYDPEGSGYDYRSISAAYVF